MNTPSQILDAAMALDTAQRAEVAHKLLLSLEPVEAKDSLASRDTDTLRH